MILLRGMVVAVVGLPMLAHGSEQKPAAGIDPAVLEMGRVQFIICSACHGQSGEGGAAGPPLAGSEWVTGPAENLIRIQLRGLRGPIEVKGVTYDFPPGMAPLAYQSDEQIAAVLTYVRNSFGNSAPAVSAEEVAALRGEVGKPMVTVADLIPVSRPLSTPNPDKYADLDTDSKPPLVVLGALAALLGLIVWFLKRRSSRGQET